MTRTLVCLWVLWEMFYVDGAQKHAPVSGPITQAACEATLKRRITYERTARVIRYYADLAPQKRAAHPTGYWVGCFPAGVDMGAGA